MSAATVTARDASGQPLEARIAGVWCARTGPDWWAIPTTGPQIGPRSSLEALEAAIVRPVDQDLAKGVCAAVVDHINRHGQPTRLVRWIDHAASYRTGWTNGHGIRRT